MKSLSIKPILLLSFILIGSFIACQKDSEIKDGNKSNNIRRFVANGLMGINQSGYYDGSIDYTSNGLKFIDSTNTQQTQTLYNLIGQFFHPTNDELVDAGKLHVGAISLHADSNFGYKYRLPSSMMLDNPIHQPHFGASINFSIGGATHFQASNVSMYVPQNIYIEPVATSCETSTTVVSKNALPFRINWNIDPNNQNGVVILIRYNSFRSQNANPSFSGIPFFNTPILLNDIGQYDITANDLNNIPVGAFFDVIIGRGNQEELLSGSKKISIQAIAQSTRTYRLGQ